MLEVTAATEIDAPAEAVWAVLTDFARFGAWNPFIRDARGSAEVGDTVRVKVRPSIPILIPLRFRATVLSHDDHELHWRGKLLAGWLGTGDHRFVVEPIDRGRVRFIQHERFSGLLPWLGARLLASETQRGFEAMNRALKARAEAAVEPS
jgi:hypothetical protein